MNSASELLRALAYSMLDGLLGDAELKERLPTELAGLERLAD